MAIKNSMNTPESRLKTLALHSRKSQKICSEWDLSDDFKKMKKQTPQRYRSWIRVLSSVAKTESIEAVVIRPLSEGYKKNPVIQDYLLAHGQDEERHGALLERYLKNSFNFKRSAKPTLSDRLIYQGLLPRIAEGFSKRPLYGIALLHCYEKFAVNLYTEIKREAGKDGALELLKLIQAIEKDELRHIAGMEILLKLEVKRNRKNVRTAQVITALSLGVVLLDVNMSSFAFHNRELRARLNSLGISPEFVNRCARNAAKSTFSFFKTRSQKLGMRSAYV